MMSTKKSTATFDTMSQHDLRLMGDYLHLAGKLAAQFDATPNVALTLTAFSDYYFTLHERVAVVHDVEHLTAFSRIVTNTVKQTINPSTSDTSIVLSAQDVRAAQSALLAAARSATQHETIGVPNVVHTLNCLAEQYGIILLSMIKNETHEQGNRS